MIDAWRLAKCLPAQINDLKRNCTYQTPLDFEARIVWPRRLVGGVGDLAREEDQAGRFVSDEVNERAIRFDCQFWFRRA